VLTLDGSPTSGYKPTTTSRLASWQTQEGYMPVLYSKNLPLLVQKRKLTDEEWQTLVRNRAELIADHLREYSTEPLGNMTFPGLGKRLSEMQPRLANPKFGLDTRGIFVGLQERPRSRHGNRVTLYGWGLDRNGKWLLIRLKVRFTIPFGHHHPTYHNHPELAVEQVAQSRINRLYPREAKDVWYELGRAANHFIESRRKAWAATENLNYNLVMEEEGVQATYRH
jgi:hypothetical protein